MAEAPPRSVAPTGPDRLVPGAAAAVFAAVDVAGVVVLGIVIGLGFDRVFDGAPLLRLAVGAAVGAAVVGEVAGRLARATATGTLLASLAALVLATPVVVSSVAPTPGAIATALADLGDAPRRILSVPLPVAPDPGLVTVVFVTVWLAVALALELARRTRDPFVPVLPPALAVVVPVVLAAGGPAPGEGRWSLVLLVAAVVVLGRILAPRPGATSSERSRRLLRRRRLLAGVPVLLAAAVLAPAVAPRAPGVAHRRLELRSVQDAPGEQFTSPLAQVDVLAEGTRGTLAFAAEGPRDPVRFHLAVLDRYDGSQWSAPNGSVRVAERFPEPDEPLAGRQATYDVTVADLGTAFLPVPGRPTELSGADVLLDQLTGNVRLRSGPVPGTTFTVTGVVPDAVDTVVDRAGRSTSGADAVVASERIADSEILGTLADRASRLPVAGAGWSPDARRLEALRAFVSDPAVFAYAEEPRGGESLAHLTRLFAGSTASADAEPSLRQGSRQQFVAGFAVMARTLGFATRVAVGYVYNGTGPITFDTSDITAWVEVKLSGAGWVPFDVGPDQDATAPDTPVDESDDSSEAATTTTSLPIAEEPDPPKPAGAASDDGPLRWAVPVIGIVLVAAAAAFARRPVRRGLRRRGDARHQVLGAWAEAVDLLGRAGQGRDPSRTVEQVTAGAGTVLAPPGLQALAHLGHLATRASWSPAGLDDDAGSQAWLRVAEVRRHRRPRRARRQVAGSGDDGLGTGPQ